MAKKLENFEFKRTGTSYPWHEWMDGAVWGLTPGVDFDCTTAAFRVSCYGSAKSRGGTVKTVMDNGTLAIQFTPNTPEETE